VDGYLLMPGEEVTAHGRSGASAAAGVFVIEVLVGEGSEGGVTGRADGTVIAHVLVEHRITFDKDRTVDRVAITPILLGTPYKGPGR